jgi:predicted DNA-binding protein
MSEATETVNIKLPITMREELRKLAAANERTFAAEARIAIKAHLQTKGAK